MQMSQFFLRAIWSPYPAQGSGAAREGVAQQARAFNKPFITWLCKQSIFSFIH